MCVCVRRVYVTIIPPVTIWERVIVNNIEKNNLVWQIDLKLNKKKVSRESIYCRSQLLNVFKMQAKFYLSIIDDVIESIRELFLDEGLEDRLVDDLRHVSSISPRQVALAGTA